MIGGVAFGAALLASAPAIVASFALPTAWAVVVSLPFLDAVAPGPTRSARSARSPNAYFSATERAHAGSTLALWMVVPLLIGIYRVTRRELTASVGGCAA